MGCSANVHSWVEDSTLNNAPLQIAWQHGVEACWESMILVWWAMVSHTDIIRTIFHDISWRGNFSWFGEAASGKSTWLESFGALHGVLRLQLLLFCWSISIGHPFQQDFHGFSGIFRWLHLVQRKKRWNMFEEVTPIFRDWSAKSNSAGGSGWHSTFPPSGTFILTQEHYAELVQRQW